MGTRYLYNTSGHYVAFVSGDNVFDIEAKWLGRILNGNEIYDARGQFFGYILDDDRVAVNTLEQKPLRVPPLRPFTPFKPFKPFTRLRMTPLQHPYRDVFEAQSTGTHQHGRSIINNHNNLAQLLDSTLVAADGTLLGMVTKNRFNSTSLTNEFGQFGSRYQSKSIFNQYGMYGSSYSQWSPFNEYSQTPPRFVKNEQILGYLSANKYVRNRIDPSEFIQWLKN